MVQFTKILHCSETKINISTETINFRIIKIYGIITLKLYAMEYFQARIWIKPDKTVQETHIRSTKLPEQK